MAIYGDLATHAFTDVTRVLRNQSGTLFLHMAYQGQTVELILDRGMLLGAFLDGFPVPNPERLQAIVHDLISNGHGEFEFQAAPATQLPRKFEIPMDSLIRQVMATSLIPEDQLPHTETRFTFVRHGQGQVPTSLTDLWTRVQPMLPEGVSARDLTNRLGMTEREARQLLYQLRAVDLVMPVRASEFGRASRPEAPATTPTRPTPVAPQPVLQRLLGALRRFTGARA